MLKAIDCSNVFFKKLKIKSNKKSTAANNNNNELIYLTNNLRMTICELG